ncbi:class I SAM-dependent methyltransferase [Chloroflexota bacterium]
MKSITYSQYLTVKKSIDDRSINPNVWSCLADSLPEKTDSHPLRVLEIGCGIGTMVERCIERGLLEHAVYEAVDRDSQLIECAIKRLNSLPDSHILQVERNSSYKITHASLEVSGLMVNLIVAEALEFTHHQIDHNLWDLIIAHAFLDLVNLDIIPALLNLVGPGGLFYFTHNFDGLTAFLPVIDPVFDQQVVHLYQRSMDERQIDGTFTGGSQTGRKLLSRVVAEGAHIIQAGASDWLVAPGETGYTDDEAVFLHAILQTVANELKDHPQLNALKFADWIDQRQKQIDSAELIFLAHQIDVIGKR